MLKDGLAENSELNLPVIDPLRLQNIVIQKSYGPVLWDARFTNLDVNGFSKAQFVSISNFSDEPGAKLELKMTLPTGSVVGPYKIKGEVLFFPIGGDGIMTFGFGECYDWLVDNFLIEVNLEEDMQMTFEFDTKRIEKDGEVFMQVANGKLNAGAEE